MVVMESVCAASSAAAAAEAAAAAAATSTANNNHNHRSSSSTGSWYDQQAAAASGAAAASLTQAGLATNSADELADAYFKGQNYFSQMQGAYSGISHGKINVKITSIEFAFSN